MNKKAMASELTKELLKSSFLELCEKKGISNVTVGAVTKKAGYNRCTFYNYYTDIPEMIAEIEENVLSEIKERISSQDLRPASIDTAFDQLLSFFENYGNTIYVLLSKSGSSDFRNRFKESAFSIYREAFAGKFTTDQIDFLITYVSSAGLGLIEHWYESGKKYSTEEFLKLLKTLVSTGIVGYLREMA